MEIFNGHNYSIHSTGIDFVLVHPVSENETFDSFDELVDNHPICEEARAFFFGKQFRFRVINVKLADGQWVRA